MIQLEATAEGVILLVKALAGARKNEVRGVQNGRLKVSVTQVAEKGKANRAIATVIARQLKLRNSQVELASGAASREKTFLLRNVEVDAVRRRIETLLNS